MTAMTALSRRTSRKSSSAFALLQRQLPPDWLEKLTVREFTDEEKAEIEALGGWDKLMETIKKRLEEQKERHRPGRQQVDRHGGNLTVRRLRLQPGGRAHRPGRRAKSKRRQGLG